jgi:ABC-2 type transport system ATP-binding protein
VREGRLVAVERLADLSGESLHHVRASFADGVRAEEFEGIPGVRDLSVRGSTMTCSAPQSALDALRKTVSSRAVVDFECAEAELDEMFLAYYSGGNHAAVLVAAAVVGFRRRDAAAWPQHPHPQDGPQFNS